MIHNLFSSSLARKSAFYKFEDNVETSFIWVSSPPLIAAVLIALKGAKSPGRGRIEEIRALVYFPPI